MALNLGKLWKTRISALLPPENPCEAKTASAVTRVFQRLPWLGMRQKDMHGFCILVSPLAFFITNLLIAFDCCFYGLVPAKFFSSKFSKLTPVLF